jgi:cupin superfamily acireductone dioxygenase involved in methionine salvage
MYLNINHPLVKRLTWIIFILLLIYQGTEYYKSFQTSQMRRQMIEAANQAEINGLTGEQGFFTRLLISMFKDEKKIKQKRQL